MRNLLELVNVAVVLSKLPVGTAATVFVAGKLDDSSVVEKLDTVVMTVLVDDSEVVVDEPSLASSVEVLVRLVED